MSLAVYSFAGAKNSFTRCPMQRLQRLDRLFKHGPVYFVTACTHHRQKILADVRVQDGLMSFAEGGPSRGAWLGAYVLMPDHLHVFVALDAGDDGKPPLQLSAWMKSLKNFLSKCLRLSGIAAPHWQKGFFDHLLRSEESYARKWEYVRDNPVRGGLVAKWPDWPFHGEPYKLDL